jgi:hypothetical protein
MRKFLRPAVAAAALTLASALPAQAGPLLWWWGGADRGVEVGAVVPYGGAPFSHRYNYGTAVDFVPDWPADKFAYLEYLDRVERAEKFGYPIPPNPFARPTPRCAPCGR